MMSLLGIPLAGYHEIGRDGTNADFDRKIKKPIGFLKVFPLLISRYSDNEDQLLKERKVSAEAGQAADALGLQSQEEEK